MPLFSKSPKKSKKTSGSTSGDESQSQSQPQSHAHAHRARSPLKKSSSSKSSKPKDESHKPEQGSLRNSRSSQKSGPNNNSPRHPFDPNTTHPLNLPPDQLRRFSALSAMSDPDRMDIDSEPPAGAPVSPPPQPQAQAKVPGSFDTPKTNSANGSAKEEGPAPPPHKSNPSSPVAPAAPTPEEAEAFKNAGNKHYKAKEYKKAIQEYTKGMDS